MSKQPRLIMIEGRVYRTKSGVVYRKYSKKEKYKYQLAEKYRVFLPKLAGRAAQISKFIYLDEEGWLTIYPGYAWDGPSGPTIDREENFRGGLIHDALYSLHRALRLSMQDRKISDEILADICVEDGMMKWWAWGAYYHAVQIFGASSARSN